MSQNYKYTFSIVILTLIGVMSCQRNGPHQPVETKVTGAKVPGETVSYEKVRPVFEKRCSRCHPASSAPDWTNEEKANEYVKIKKSVLITRVSKLKTMPLAGSPEANAITDDERNLIVAWASGGDGGSGDGGSGGGDGGGGELPPAGPFAAVEKCISCHGVMGNSAMSGVPSLAGQSDVYLRAQLSDFKTGKRVDAKMGAMGGIASGLTVEEENFVIEYFSRMAMSPKALTETIPDLDKKIERAREIVKMYTCAACHADQHTMRSVSPEWPGLYGQDHNYIINQLKAFKNNTRGNAQLMPGLVMGISEDDFEALGLYFRTLTPEELKVIWKE